MECNKEEGVRAKELAEKKMNSKDYVGARRMVVKAQKLYPGIENISQMLTVCEVHCSAECRVLGSDPDWYDILQIEQTADEASIKKQFRKLALQLHPDKNKFPGAEAAFKLIEEAQRLLCDQSKRSQFDMKRNTMRPGQQMQSQNHPSRSNDSSKQPGMHSNPSSTGAAAQFKSMNPHQQKQQQIPPVYANSLLWTVCPFCSIRYHRDIMNRAPRCRRCMKPFIVNNLNKQGMASGVNNPPSPQKNDLNKRGMPSGVNNLPSPQKKKPRRGGRKVAPVKMRGKCGNVAPVSQPPKMSGRASVAGRAAKPNVNEDVNVRVEAGKKGKCILAEPKPQGTKSRKRGRNSDPEEVTDSFKTESSCDREEDGDRKAGQNPGLNSGHHTRRSSRLKHDVSYKE